MELRRTLIIETLSNAKPEAWVTVLGVFFGAMISSITAWITTNLNTRQSLLRFKIEEQAKKNNLQKERLEELYILVCHWGNEFFAIYASLNLVMRGHCTYNEHLDMITSKQIKHDFSRIEMIVDVYGSDISDAFKSVLNARELINKITSAHKSSYRNGETGERYIQPATDAQIKLSDAIDSLKMAIAFKINNS